MSEVQLSRQTLTKTIVTLNDNVIGYFTTSGLGGAVHVGHVRSIEITANRKGKSALTIRTELLTFMKSEEIDDDQLEKARAWVAEVQRGMGSG